VRGELKGDTATVECRDELGGPSEVDTDKRRRDVAGAGGEE
jgi:hypothetical protein